MLWCVLAHFVAFLVDLATAARPTDRDKDLEIVLLRHQVRLLQRRHPRPPRPSLEKLTLVVLAAKLKCCSAGPHTRLGQALLVFRPEPYSSGIGSSCAASEPG